MHSCSFTFVTLVQHTQYNQHVNYRQHFQIVSEETLEAVLLEVHVYPAPE